MVSRYQQIVQAVGNDQNNQRTRLEKSFVNVFEFVKMFVAYIDYDGRPVSFAVNDSGFVSVEALEHLKRHLQPNPEGKVSILAKFTFGREFETTVSVTPVGDAFVYTMFGVSIASRSTTIEQVDLDRIIAAIPNCPSRQPKVAAPAPAVFTTAGTD